MRLFQFLDNILITNSCVLVPSVFRGVVYRNFTVFTGIFRLLCFLIVERYYIAPRQVLNQKDNGFDGLLRKYFYKNGAVEPVSLMDNGPVLDALKLFWQ